MGIPKTLLSALSLNESADETSALNALSDLKKRAESGDAAVSLNAKLNEATGETGEASLGVALAWKESHDKLPELQSQLDKATADASARELDVFLQGARDGSSFSDKSPRLTKAEADNIREQVTAGNMTLEAAKGFVSVKAPVAHLSGAPNDVPAPLTSDKEYRNMTHLERAELERNDSALFNQLRKEWEAAGSPEPETKPAS